MTEANWDFVGDVVRSVDASLGLVTNRIKKRLKTETSPQISSEMKDLLWRLEVVRLWSRFQKSDRERARVIASEECKSMKEMSPEDMSADHVAHLMFFAAVCTEPYSHLEGKTLLGQAHYMHHATNACSYTSQLMDEAQDWMQMTNRDS